MIIEGIILQIQCPARICKHNFGGTCVIPDVHLRIEEKRIVECFSFEHGED